MPRCRLSQSIRSAHTPQSCEHRKKRDASRAPAADAVANRLIAVRLPRRRTVIFCLPLFRCANGPFVSVAAIFLGPVIFPVLRVAPLRFSHWLMSRANSLHGTNNILKIRMINGVKLSYREFAVKSFLVQVVAIRLPLPVPGGNSCRYCFQSRHLRQS